LSAYFERNREEYVDLLLDVSRNGAWHDWIRLFLRGVAEQSEQAIVTCQRLLELWQQYRARMQTARASALGLNLIDALFSSPGVTIPSAASQLNVTYASAKLVIHKLVEAGILREATGRRRNRIYVAPEILGIIASRQERKPEEEIVTPSQERPPASQ
jgi:Fic family protein